MIKVHTLITPTPEPNGINLDTEVIVAVPKGMPEEISDILCKHEIKALLKNMYKRHPDIVVDAIEEFTEELEHDKTDIDNN